MYCVYKNKRRKTNLAVVEIVKKNSSRIYIRFTYLKESIASLFRKRQMSLRIHTNFFSFRDYLRSEVLQDQMDDLNVDKGNDCGNDCEPFLGLQSLL